MCSSQAAEIAHMKKITKQLRKRSDSNRQQEIAGQFSELYDKEWKYTLEMLLRSGSNEREAIEKLITTVKTCFQYCETISEKQMNQMSCVLSLCPDENCGYGYKDLEKEVVQTMRDLRKMTGLEDYCMASLKKDFRNSEAYKKLPKEKAEDRFSKYIDVCLKCGWLSSVQDPPVVFDFDIEPLSEYDSNYTDEYTQSGKYVDYLVWPCMLSRKSGPLLKKGVVQCTYVQNEGMGKGNADDVPEENERLQRTPKV